MEGVGKGTREREERRKEKVKKVRECMEGVLKEWIVREIGRSGGCREG